MPTLTPALVNSVISCGSSAPRGLVSRLYQPQPGRSSQSLAKPAMLVDSARSALQAITSGRSYSARAVALTQAPQAASAARLGAFSPGCFQIAAG
jgi:ABC-type amino acid transport system permease subunit